MRLNLENTINATEGELPNNALFFFFPSPFLHKLNERMVAYMNIPRWSRIGSIYRVLGAVAHSMKSEIEKERNSFLVERKMRSGSGVVREEEEKGNQ